MAPETCPASAALSFGLCDQVNRAGRPRRCIVVPGTYCRANLAGGLDEPIAVNHRNGRPGRAELRDKRRPGDPFDPDPTAVNLLAPARLVRAGITLRRQKTARFALRERDRKATASASGTRGAASSCTRLRYWTVTGALRRGTTGIELLLILVRKNRTPPQRVSNESRSLGAEHGFASGHRRG